MKDLVVVGGGILGLAIARQYAIDRPGAEVTVLEKEADLGTHQTGRNSGVVHAGIYYKPGSLKAKLSRRGVGLLKAYCEEQGIPYEECGKLVVAVDEDEIPALDELERRATENGVPGLERVGRTGISDREPTVEGRAALWSPQTAITDFHLVAAAYARDLRKLGGSILTSSRVVDITNAGDEATVHTDTTSVASRSVIVCAGLHGDRLAVSGGDDADPRIVPFRGEYFRLVRTSLVRGLVYPVPDPRYPFLGVHFTKTTSGEVLVGPNAVLAFAREGYRYRDISPRDLWDTVAWTGFRALARQNWRAGRHELWLSLNRSAYLRETQRYIPQMTKADLERAPAGVRAQAVSSNGSLVDDFRITAMGPITFVRNAPSPAATASLAIAQEIVGRLAA